MAALKKSFTDDTPMNIRHKNAMLCRSSACLHKKNNPDEKYI